MGQQEEWRPCARFPNYEVSNTGRVRLIGMTKSGRPMKDRKRVLSTSGYWCFVLKDVNGRPTPAYLHRLMVEAFIGRLGERGKGGFQVNHKNGIRTDCRLSNMERVTASENVKHGYDTGLNDLRNHWGERAGCVKVTAEEVREIRRRLLGGESARVVARDYPISVGEVNAIKDRRKWQWLDPCDPVPKPCISNSGHRHSRALFTKERVLEIRRRVALGERQCDIANEFGVSRPSVNMVVTGRTYNITQLEEGVTE